MKLHCPRDFEHGPWGTELDSPKEKHKVLVGCLEKSVTKYVISAVWMTCSWYVQML